MAKTEAAKKEKKASPAAKSGKKLTGYMKFCQEKRPQVKEENPGIVFGQIGKKLGEMWRELDDAAKEKYKA